MKAVWIEYPRKLDGGFYPRISKSGFTDAVILAQKSARRFDDDVPELLEKLDGLGIKSHLAINLCMVHYAGTSDDVYVDAPGFFDILDESHRAKMVENVVGLAQRYNRPIQLDYVRSGVDGHDEDYAYRNALALLLSQIRNAVTVELSAATSPVLCVNNPQYSSWGIDVERWLREGSIDWVFDMNYVYPEGDHYYSKWNEIHARTRQGQAMGRVYPLGTCYARDPRPLNPCEFGSVVSALEAYDYGIYPHTYFTDSHAEIMSKWN